MENRARIGPRAGRPLRLARSTLAGLLALVVPFAPFAPGTASTDSSGTRDALGAQNAIESANKKYVEALQRKDGHAFAALFTDDAVSMPPFSPMVHGRLEIESAIGEVFKRVTFGVGRLHTLETHVSTNSAFEIGTYQLPLISDGYPTTLHGRYLVVWRKVGATWKIAAESSQADVVPEPAVSSTPAAIIGPVPGRRIPTAHAPASATPTRATP